MQNRLFRRGIGVCLFLAWMTNITNSAKAEEESPKEIAVLEPVVVTATRTEVLREEAPAAVTVVEEEAIDQTSGRMLTDILSRNASVDVINYPGVLSGIGLRGFRPEFSGTNKHTLLLIDGRPSGATNLSTILNDDIERIEVLKGPASSLYGSEAMGGVINIITKRSAGPPRTNLTLTGGSFGHRQAILSSGGGWAGRFDYDLNLSALYRNDFKTGTYGGGGAYGSDAVRPFTGWKEGGIALRLGRPLLSDRLRVDLRGDLYTARDVESPGALPEGETNQGRKDVDRNSLDLAFKGELGTNRWLARIYRTSEGSNFQRRSNTTGQFVQSFETVIDQIGGQLQDTIALQYPWGLAETTVGLDLSMLEQPSKSWHVNTPGVADGAPRAPFSPDYEKKTLGLFAEERLGLMGERLFLTAGARYDRYALETLPTPLKTDFTPGKATSDILSPRGGIVVRILEPLRFHATIGRAFVAPAASQVAGFAETVRSGQLFVTQGNPNLKPENSVSWDAGVTWRRPLFRVDATYFDTHLRDKIETVSVGVIEGKTVSSYANISKARIQGLETEFDLEIGELLRGRSSLALFARHTWIIKKEAESPAGQRDSTFLNVADQKVTYGLTYEDGRHLSGRLSARYVGEAADFDFYSPGLPLTTRDKFHVVDLSAGYRLNPAWSFNLRIDNLFDTFYEEKKEFPMPGRSFFLAAEMTL